MKYRDDMTEAQARELLEENARLDAALAHCQRIEDEARVVEELADDQYDSEADYLDELNRGYARDRF